MANIAAKITPTSFKAGTGITGVPHVSRLSRRGHADCRHPRTELALAFGNDGELHAEGVQDGIDGFEAWVGACA